MTGAEHREYLRTFEEIKNALVAAQKERDVRRNLVDGQPAWIYHERARACDVVNQIRARMGKDPVATPLVVRAEMRAAGHVDYTQKFALGCADLVHDHFVAGA
jgi:hypothetical protein